jgi:hypothetical protein
MTNNELANQLRQRQYDRKLIARDKIDTLSDDQIIDSYITCSCCGNKQFNEKQVTNAIRAAKNANQFFQYLRICDSEGLIYKVP